MTEKPAEAACYVEDCPNDAPYRWNIIGVLGGVTSGAALCLEHKAWADDAMEWVCRGVKPAEIDE